MLYLKITALRDSGTFILLISKRDKEIGSTIATLVCLKMNCESIVLPVPILKEICR